MRPILSLIVPGALEVGFDVRAFRSRAARRASLTLRDCGGGRRLLLLVVAGGSKEDAISPGRGAWAVPRVDVLGGVTQNM